MRALRPTTTLLLAVATLAVLLLTHPFIVCFAQPAAGSGSGEVVDLPLVFHGYSLLFKDANNSIYAYDGVDGAAPTKSSPVSVELSAQIPGQYSGFSYWSAVMMWVVKLDSDVHVQGTVNMHAYISSTSTLDGFFSGAGYGMGIVDIDENNNEVKQFVTEGPIAIGRSPFTSQPTLFSLDTAVDYVFKKGHAIGFVVGLGATTQGFKATVYFDSQSQNSGATLPIVNQIESYNFPANQNGVAYNVAISSNSAISDYRFDPSTKALQFKATGINYTSGQCDVWIPKALMQQPFKISAGTQQITPNTSENGTHSHLSFTHLRSADPIIIEEMQGTAQPSGTQPSSTQSSSLEPVAPTNTAPEFPFLLPIFVIAIATGLTAILVDKLFSSKKRGSSKL